MRCTINGFEARVPANSHKVRRRAARALKIGLAGACVLGLILFVRGYLYRVHFGTVQKGVLYRSAQPNVADLRVMRRLFGIKTVVNLRGEDTPRRLRESLPIRKYAEKAGIGYVVIPVRKLPSRKHVQQFLSIMDDPARRPVLVHCAKGTDRTGVMVAAYRVQRQGWSKAAAANEMKARGFDMPHHRKALRRVANEGPAAGESPGLTDDQLLLMMLNRTLPIERKH